ncbi:bifunctional methylenetetrahydrofolate dehydrogenase/methenyltetrahydrofolate cyclohydrolase FolD [Caldalkalibacillus mannanilyticus]|uniref:bifunctional methylenetetrahydrofolate dehydrogenase/methenyltetrahydrofolate cyclohydrolase FolD n=1 Tax=Caldalkalibacillus mannanilyticus TaxID=1418 RepID=UPI0004693AB7|nr:bifunctional methylenetetrahydrofolate dehydrogenase/methenyltetrahydrofolate cyclohydrolase FolD [Caldalkalibacillus mannanilyticus]
MSAKIIDGKAIASQFREKMKEELKQLKSQEIIPGLAVIIIGEDPASVSYVKAKIRACEEVGIYSRCIRLSGDTTEQELLQHIDKLNQDVQIHGILVQLPLPLHISEKAVIDAISPEKDVDGFHPMSVGNMLIGDECFLPCTPHGIVKMIQHTGTELAGKNVVVVGRSNIVGKPVSMLLLQENATVTICHSKTQNLAEHTKKADILVVAVGKAGVIGPEHVSEGTIVIDVGVNRNAEGKLVGDVRFDELLSIASHITPVPGGVGPMTITMLLYNTIESAKKHLPSVVV